MDRLKAAKSEPHEEKTKPHKVCTPLSDTKSGNRNVIYEYKSEVEARMVILSGCRRETEIQRGLPPLRPAMQAEFPGRHGGVSVIPLEEDRRGQKNVGIKVEKTAIYPL